MSLPTILFWRDGAEAARLGGADATPENIIARIEEMTV
jgi:hypothetical protein